MPHTYTPQQLELNAALDTQYKARLAEYEQLCTEYDAAKQALLRAEALLSECEYVAYHCEEYIPW